MKKSITLITSLFFLTISPPNFADWTRVSTTPYGDGSWVDFESIRKHGGYVYYWDMQNYLQPLGDAGVLSTTAYNQGDCGLFRFKILSFNSYKQPKGEGAPNTYSPKNPEWKYPTPTSSYALALKAICAYQQ